MSKKRVLLVDDNATVCRAVRPLFDSHARFEVVGEAEHGLEAVEKAPILKPDLIVLDLSMPVMNGQGSGTATDQDPAQRLDHTFNGPRNARGAPPITRGGDTCRGSEEQGFDPLDRAGRIVTLSSLDRC
jgi:hypothetical protein